MIFLYKQEIFKLLKKKSLWFCLLFIVLQNIGVAILGNAYPKYINVPELFKYDFASLSFTVLILIAASSTIISTEYEYNTIKNIVMQPYSRTMILISKWLTILTYAIGIYLLSILMSLMNKFIFFNNSFSLTDKLNGKENMIWQDWLIVNGANFITLWLILSIVFLLASVMKKGAVAVIVGVVSYFAMNIIGSMMFVLIERWEFLKWNPLNFLNYPGQLANVGILSELTHLSNTQLLIGNLSYIVLFMGVGLYFFSKKEI